MNTISIIIKGVSLHCAAVPPPMIMMLMGLMESCALSFRRLLLHCNSADPTITAAAADIHSTRHIFNLHLFSAAQQKNKQDHCLLWRQITRSVNKMQSNH
jgi:hypothetical protein